MVSESRWETAQVYERSYWQAQAAQIATGAVSRLDWYRWRADQLTARLRRLGIESLVDGSARVVEVGSGPVGLVTFYPARERTAYDPLSEFYAANQALTELRDPLVDYVGARGEALPRDDGSADLVIIENCIDHVQDMDAVMQELRRVLASHGVLYLTVNNRTRIGYVVHRMLSRLKIDRGHPHTFTPARTVELFRRNGFDVVDVEIGSYSKAWLEDIRSREPKALARAALGVSEYVVSVIARRSD